MTNRMKCVACGYVYEYDWTGPEKRVIQGEEFPQLWMEGHNLRDDDDREYTLRMCPICRNITASD